MTDERIASTVEAMRLIQDPKEGLECWVEENEQTYVYNDGEWIKKLPNKMTLYALNKMIIAQMPTYSQEDFDKAKKVFLEYKNKCESKYYMLLCKDIGYYTLFAYSDKIDENMEDIAIECLSNLGEVKSIQYNETENVIEIWVSIDKEPYVLYFFQYDEGVVECR